MGVVVSDSGQNLDFTLKAGGSPNWLIIINLVSF